ncbi:MAG TPA: amino acid adenylation domain-containing protein [Lachnospiraceae bacterium]|nr:amino acid adenylation domain-containing protein [Lachnospiraceae bacterium]
MSELYERVNHLTPEKRKLLLEKINSITSTSSKEQTIQPIPREESGYEFPLSYSQQRLWFLYQWEKDSPSYNIPCLFHLPFDVNIESLKKAINMLIERHEILRTTYRMYKEDAVQVIKPYESIPMEVSDFRDSKVNERELRDTFVKEKAIIPFNLEEEFPIRAYFYMLPGTDNYLLLNIHHIACDGWSLDIIMNEIQNSYTSMVNEQPINIQPLPIQYADFASWQRQNESTQTFCNHEKYWKNVFEGEVPVLELPTDKQRPPVRSFQGAYVTKTLPENLYRDLNRFCLEEDVTLYMATLTAYAILLYKYTGQTDIVIGSPIANRNRTEVEKMIGFFVNTLPIRIKLNENATFRETVKQVRKVTIEAYEHQELPLEKIIEMLKIERDMSHNPLFQVMYVMQNMHVASFDTEEMRMRFEGSINTNSSKFDLTLSSAGDYLQAEYSTDIFDKRTMEKLLDHYVNIMESVRDNPDQVITGISILSEEEENHILYDWNDTEWEYDGNFHVVRSIELQALKSPNHIALVFEGRSYTYEELNTYSNQLANYLIMQGIGPDKIVGIYLERSAEFVLAMLAILKAGGAYVPLDPSYPKDRIQHMIKESGMQMLLTKSKLSSEIALPNVVMFNLDQNEKYIHSQNMENPVIRSKPNNLMYIIFTSGSTGKPKGVGVELRNFHNYIQGIIKHLQIEEPLSYAMISTLAADLGLTNVFCALCTGGTLHVLSYERSCDPDAVADYFRSNRIDIMKAVPSHFEVLLTASNPVDVIPHKTLVLAGEGLSYETVRKVRALRPSCSIENHYGPTETTVSAMTYKVPEDIEGSYSNFVPIGKPLGNVKAYILDSKLQPVPIGVPGELHIGGKGVTRGYLQSPDMTHSKFIRNPFLVKSEDILYKTGDRVRYLTDGSIEILGRMDRQIKIRGFRIELGEIESVITSHPTVKDCAVIVKELSKTDKRIVAYIIFEKTQADKENMISELRRNLGKKLPEYMVPNHMMELESLPLNLNGKVDLHNLPDIDLNRKSMNGNGELPQTDTQKMIHNVWSEVLGVEGIGIDDNFFELGGESFKALKVVRRIGDWIGIMDFFKNPTIRQLAAFIEQGEKSENQILHQLKKSSMRAVETISVVCVPYAGGSAITYQPLAKQVPANFELYAIEIPGHDYSRKEEGLLSLQETARLCVDEIKKKITGTIALYGHCVGGALTIEIARQLEEEKLPLARVFVGGALPIAHLPGRIFNFFAKLFPTDRAMSNKSYHEFLKALGGFNDVGDSEERDFLIRNLRHDARESENYFSEAFSTKEYSKLLAPITCIIGQKDRATDLYQERYLEWGYFSRHVDLAVIPMSGHYFIKYQADQLSEIMHDSLLKDNLSDQVKGFTEHIVQQEQEVGASINGIQVNIRDSNSSTNKEESETIRKEHKSSSSQHIIISASKRVPIPNLRTFFIVVLSQLVSVLGSGLTSIALGVWVFSRTGSVTDFAAISSAGLIPGILVLPVAGAIVDRYDRRLVMLFSDLLAALSIAALAILMATNHLEVWHIYITSAIGSMSRSFHRPAFMASIAQIIPKQYLGHANGVVQFSSSTSEMIAPLIGVALYTLIGMKNIFILDFFSFFVAITALVCVRFPNSLFHKREETFVKEVLMGWKFIIKRPSFIYMIIFFFIGNVLFGAVTVLFQPLVLSFGSANQLATTSMLGAIGGMAGALLMSLWGGTKRRATGMIGFVIMEGFFVIVTGLRPSFIFPAIGIFGFWFCVTLVNSHWQSLIQTKVGLELQGRVLATNQMLASSSMPIGYFVGGLLVDSVLGKAMEHGGALADIFGPVIGVGPGRGIGLLLLLAGTLVILWSTIGFRFKPLRYMEDNLEDAIPDAIIRDRDSLQEELDNKIAGSI